MKNTLIMLIVLLITLSSCCNDKFVTPDYLSDELSVVPYPSDINEAIKDKPSFRAFTTPLFKNNDVIRALGNE